MTFCRYCYKDLEGNQKVCIDCKLERRREWDRERYHKKKKQTNQKLI